MYTVYVIWESLKKTNQIRIGDLIHTAYINENDEYKDTPNVNFFSEFISILEEMSEKERESMGNDIFWFYSGTITINGLKKNDWFASRMKNKALKGLIYSRFAVTEPRTVIDFCSN